MGLVLLDLDGTLVDQAGAARRWSAEFVDTWGLPTTEVEHVATALAVSAPKGGVFAGLQERFALSSSADELWAGYRRRMPELVTCDPRDLDALERLRSAGWALGIVTNGMADNQLGKIRAVGLDARVDGWVVSGEAGVSKPDPRIFELAAARCGTPLRGWMVGDSPQNDVAGGAAVGLRTAWVARPGSTAGDIEPDVTVPSVAAAATAILAWGN